MKYSLCDDFLNAKKIVYPMVKYLSSYLDGTKDYAPWSVEIHPTAKCNHRCIHCSYQERNESRVEMPKEMFWNLLESLIQMKVHGVYFSGGGEPCTYEGLSDGIQNLKENGVEVALVTNGTLFERMGLMEVADCINYIAFSVPSCTEDIYEKITGRKLMEEVLSLPDKIKKRWGGRAPILGARVVITNLIAEEVPCILTTLKKRNFDYALFKIVRDYEDRGLGVSEEMIDKLKIEVQNLKENGDLDSRFTNLERIFAYRNPYNPDGICHINRMGLLAAITPEGDVYPNISEIGHSEFKIGNLYEQSFEKIWNSEKHKHVKDISDRQWQSGLCKNCRAISYNLRIQDMVGHLPCEEDPFI
ncbi:radical SAM additional 4Fe4S-binding SPASM domain-containing protein [Selenomonas ruminantium]|uniref:Radical SAM additional 4Fe4S-binding SPASM domain-containing protein n=1 Tax=Selenomonas ruminantium TaxID=971 RepID=A0A1I3CPD7_SELRU|nr:radical SAM protein [Selenomonas ruminantium]SFH76233.1 radical SAM additional 4Fe4S-binding SPASM domain-containing protein [Selenomonas ruminantium]